MLGNNIDAITNSLVLCSAEDQDQATTEIKRLVNPNGGTYGYIEHVAVNLENEAEKDLAFLN
jgi:ubiquinone/menaquinone biosynthesis C-methylase UbiE